MHTLEQREAWGKVDRNRRLFERHEHSSDRTNLAVPLPLVCLARNYKHGDCAGIGASA